MIRPGVTGHAARQSLLMLRALAAFAITLLAMLISPAWAQSFPELTGRVVDAANILPDDARARIDAKLTAIEQQSQRQFVVVTLPDLQGYDISDYGYQLGRHWGIGDKERNDGVLLIVAPKERKIRIEVGYGLEPILTDGLTSLIVQNEVVPRFKAGDMAGGIEAGADAVIRQLTLPAEEARKIAAEARPQKQKEASPLPGFIFLAFIMLVFVLPAVMRSRRGTRYHSDGLGPIIVWSVLDSLSRGSSHGGGSGFGGGGGFSGGGGSFGGGGASGSW